ncbi:ANTAR domain-containing protein [Streptomyces sp. SID13726]|uniref:ANTAR domain-containing protein n=1 Tax=Streptomyces sp. SID13726 TaxID=2706058 RepID=UPI0013BC8345|nr:ANTAR domain-containing protein [Streptomyces sp. SID13726]NEA98782.1 ANTAR domain-containing protein [Streptomyces sp. SID13726]
MPEPAHSAQPLTAPESGPPCLATVEYVVADDRAGVTCRGELDIGAQRLQRTLHDILDRSATGLDLDLSAVAFCDCGGLNVLLGLRRQALAQGKTVTVLACSPPVERLLELTGAHELLVHDGTDGQGSAATGPDDKETEEAKKTEEAKETEEANEAEETTPAGVLAESARPVDVSHELRTEVAQLRRAMQSRPAIDLARGILMASFGLSAEDAWSVLVTASQNTNTKVHHLAQHLMGTVHGAPLPDEVRRQMAAAVAQVRDTPLPPSGTPTTPSDDSTDTAPEPRDTA